MYKMVVCLHTDYSLTPCAVVQGALQENIQISVLSPGVYLGLKDKLWSLCEMADIMKLCMHCKHL